VFAEPDGTPIHPDKFRKRFEVRIGRSGLPPIRFHDLRHTYATLALRAGVHPKAEEVGFEPTGPSRVRRLSRSLPSATRPLLREGV
jgi:hypothetical protein